MITLRITTHSGDEDIIQVENFDAEEITKQRNDNDIQAITIGDISYSKIDLKNVKPIYDGTVE